MRELSEHASLTLRELADTQPPEGHRLLEGGLAGGIGIKSVRVTGYGDGNRTLMCKDLDADHEPVGDAFEVYVRSQPAEAGGNQGEADLTMCLPLIEVGQEIDVRSGSAKLAGEVVTGLIMLGHVYGFCTEAP